MQVKVVYASGKEDVEDRLTIALAQADAEATSKVLGIATHDIGDTDIWFCCSIWVYYEP